MSTLLLLLSLQLFILKENRNTNLKRDTHPDVHSSTIYKAKIWKQPKCPLTDEWIKKMWYIYTVEYYSVINKNEIIAICSNMNGLRDYYIK